MDQNALVPLCKLKTAGASTSESMQSPINVDKSWIALVADWCSPGAMGVLKQAGQYRQCHGWDLPLPAHVKSEAVLAPECCSPSGLQWPASISLKSEGQN